MPCQSCGREQPTHMVTLYQNIGMIALFRYKTLKGNFCMPCLRHFFWEYTLVTLALGWWGLISFFLTPMMLINNLFFYLRSLFKPAPSNPLTMSVPPAPSVAAFGSTNSVCPRCQGTQATTIVPVGAVWASLGLAALFLVWAINLAVPMLQYHMTTNWPVVEVLLGLDLLVGFCFVMLLRNPLQQCAQCKWEWPKSI